MHLQEHVHGVMHEIVVTNLRKLNAGVKNAVVMYATWSWVDICAGAESVS